MGESRPGVVVAGTSLGGLVALGRLLAALPASFPWPLAVVQHRSPQDSPLAELLQATTRLQVVEPADKTPMQPGHVYIAPPDYHLLVEASGSLALSDEARVSHARPSIDVLFDSAGVSFGRRVIAVLLTGSSTDGTAGARAIHARGGVVIAQDPTTAESPRMPGAAIAAGVVDHVLPLDRIGPLLVELTGP